MSCHLGGSNVGQHSPARVNHTSQLPRRPRMLRYVLHPNCKTYNSAQSIAELFANHCTAQFRQISCVSGQQVLSSAHGEQQHQFSPRSSFTQHMVVLCQRRVVPARGAAPAAGKSPRAREPKASHFRSDVRRHHLCRPGRCAQDTSTSTRTTAPSLSPIRRRRSALHGPSEIDTTLCSRPPPRLTAARRRPPSGRHNLKVRPLRPNLTTQSLPDGASQDANADSPRASSSNTSGRANRQAEARGADRLLRQLAGHPPARPPKPSKAPPRRTCQGRRW
jgi:hypothetical protein